MAAATKNKQKSLIFIVLPIEIKKKLKKIVGPVNKNKKQRITT